MRTFSPRGASSTRSADTSVREYAPQLEAWRARFDPAQIHVIVAEEFFADPAAAYRGVLDFLGLPMPARPPQFKAFNARPAGDFH